MIPYGELASCGNQILPRKTLVALLRACREGTARIMGTIQTVKVVKPRILVGDVE